MGFFTWISGANPSQTDAEAQANLARLQALNKERRDALQQATIDEQQRLADLGQTDPSLSGTIDRYNQEAQYADNVQLDSVDAAAQQGFGEGLQQGWQNILDFPGKLVGGATGAAGSILGGILKAIPWWVWVSAAVYIFVTLGGLRFLKELRK
jgi:hypothetical protein